jgi:hypothetical protein
MGQQLLSGTRTDVRAPESNSKKEGLSRASKHSPGRRSSDHVPHLAVLFLAVLFFAALLAGFLAAAFFGAAFFAPAAFFAIFIPFN